MARKNRIGYRLGAIGFAVAVAAPMFVGGGEARASHCTGSDVVDWDLEAEDTGRPNLFGVKGNIYVNDFGAAQHRSVRSVYIFFNTNNFAEVGWHVGHEVFPTELVVNKVWVSNGAPDHEHFTSPTLDPNTTHEWKIHDENVNRSWSFAYDGNPLGNQFILMDYGRPGTLTEVHCKKDSAWAHFTSLKDCLTACIWQPFAQLSQVEDENPNYCFQKISNSEHYVKQVC